MRWSRFCGQPVKVYSRALRRHWDDDAAPATRRGAGGAPSGAALDAADWDSRAIYRKPRTSVAQPGHQIYPYLLRGLTIDRLDQVWCADITYIPVSAGFLYLVAVMDWASRHVLVVAAVEHDGERLLRGGAGGGAGDGHARHLQHGPRGSSSRARRSPTGSVRRGRRARWTVGDAAWPTCSSSGCGGR